MTGTRIDIKKLKVDNPKVYADLLAPQNTRLFPYYAGYSASFATNLLQSMKLGKGALVLDPWNGSGTTTSAAVQLGCSVVGQDLNPVMVLVAKAALLPRSEVSSLVPLAKSILSSIQPEVESGLHEEPLEKWLSRRSAKFFRAIETNINQVLVSHQKYLQLTSNLSLGGTSPLAAFFYLSLFAVARRLLLSFIPSNPTWVKTPALASNRLKPADETIRELFIEEITSLALRKEHCMWEPEIDHRATILLGSSEKLSLSNASVDAVITSPPYCTRIDYAVATSIELAVLRLSVSEFTTIRRSLMGASTVSAEMPSIYASWGETCVQFMERLYEHPSKASKTYYFKNHLQYFCALNQSLNELSRVLSPSGVCVLVVQDSYYKELKNDIAGIAVDMAKNAGISIRLRNDFSSNRSMASINKKAREYLEKRITTESVLCFSRT